MNKLNDNLKLGKGEFDTGYLIWKFIETSIEYPVSSIFMPMNYYAQEVAKLNKQLHSKEHLLKQIIRAKKFIDKNYSEAISIDDLACEAALSKFHFQRLFKEKYGRTVNNYLQEVRIVQAKKLLKNRMTVTEACGAVGFESVPTFSRLFKTMTGTSPSRFQKKHF